MAEMLRFDGLPGLPDGVVVLRRYRSLAAALVECHHADLISIIGGGYRPVEGKFCRVCRTKDPTRPVKLLAIVPDGDAQPSLF